MNRILLFFIGFLCVADAAGQQFRFSPDGQRIVDRPEGSVDVDKPEPYNIHFQSTYIYQYKPWITSPYQGKNSLDSNEEKQNSITATLYMGARLWKGAEVYVNPELAGGSGLSSALGMAGSSNGETFRVGSSSPTLYLARAYVKQTFTLRNRWSRKMGMLNTQEQSSDANQLAGYSPLNYLRIYAGKLSLPDIFDNNAYANSARSQFANWALMNNGAWDFAANTRGYTYAFVTELQLGKMNYKAAISSVPLTANGPKLSTDPYDGFALNGEVSRSIKIRGKQGNIRLLGFYNATLAARYSTAIRLSKTYGTKPDISRADTSGFTNSKYGVCLNFDQQLSNTFGLFGRVGWNNGESATWCFTEIDQTATVGLSANGNKWNRPADDCGIALVANGISQDHQKYLEIGGYGFILGDGTLAYAPEFVCEVYYSFKPLRQGIWFTGDYQFCLNPGYNADRGPVNIFSFRLHAKL